MRLKEILWHLANEGMAAEVVEELYEVLKMIEEDYMRKNKLKSRPKEFYDATLACITLRNYLRKT